ncbi:hypothetical protein PFISCL1PPCAC_27615, partial [Pristionchus fissidentatus]
EPCIIPESYSYMIFPCVLILAFSFFLAHFVSFPWYWKWFKELIIGAPKVNAGVQIVRAPVEEDEGIEADAGDAPIIHQLAPNDLDVMWRHIRRLEENERVERNANVERDNR